MSSGVLCCGCRKVEALFRCQSCGPGVFYCSDCFESCHSTANIFHVAEKWENGHFTAMGRIVGHPDVRPCQSYCTGRNVELDVVDEHGTSHMVRILCCDCEPLTVTLCRANLWPASPTNPRVAFTYGLLDLVEALLLECQVALKDFCSALKYRNPFPILKNKEIYGSLIDAFEEYRFMKHQVRQMHFFDEALDLGDQCPACPQNNGKIVLAMDALFGLPRKKSAGLSYRRPLYRDLHFLDQEVVDQYVSDYPKSKALAVECNDFVAGSMIRSANRYHRLDETAVYGYCCRHEFPGRFFNLKHGERLSYAVYMLEQILATHSNDQIFVMYDIACSLSQHLKLRKRTDILDRLDLSLPTFHCYGHKVSCQMQYSPRRCAGIGLSDGETMERLWSILRRFSKMTKEMRPSHRIDILTSALLFYGAKTTRKLEEIEKWLADEAATCATDSHRARPAEWQIQYFHLLQLYYALRTQIALGKKDVNSSGQLAWLEVQLGEWELKHSLTRWLPSSAEYKQLECYIVIDKKQQLLLELWKGSQRRLFLTKLMRKYADGQKVAKKISVQISKETKSLKSLYQDYNMCCGDDTTSEYLSLDEVLTPAALETRLQDMGVWCLKTVPEKREAMDSYLMLCRSKEEMFMLSEDIQNVINFHEKKASVIIQKIDELGCDTPYNRGVKSLLHELLLKASSLLKEAKQVYSVMQEGDDAEVYFSDSEYCDSGSSDDE